MLHLSWPCNASSSRRGILQTTRYQYETSMRLHVEPYFGGTAMGAVRPKHLQAWLKWRVEERGYRESSRAKPSWACRSSSRPWSTCDLDGG
ncbi:MULTISPECIES: tyrosine-type recombinase/integrase [Streptomyces]|uniref:hypothetical protein n=1 Tax=Streptomyces TaxID=1883 RepID=UPI00338FEF9B